MPALTRLRDYIDPESEVFEQRVHRRFDEDGEVDGVFILFSPVELQGLLNLTRGHGSLGGAYFLLCAAATAFNDEGVPITV